jgi:Fe-S oxidoreductase
LDLTILDSVLRVCSAGLSGSYLSRSLSHLYHLDFRPKIFGGVVTGCGQSSSDIPFQACVALLHYTSFPLRSVTFIEHTTCRAESCTTCTMCEVKGASLVENSVLPRYKNSSWYQLYLDGRLYSASHEKSLLYARAWSEQSGTMMGMCRRTQSVSYMSFCRNNGEFWSGQNDAATCDV